MENFFFGKQFTNNKNMCFGNIDKFITCIFKINDAVAKYLERRNSG